MKNERIAEDGEFLVYISNLNASFVLKNSPKPNPPTPINVSATLTFNSSIQVFLSCFFVIFMKKFF